MLHHADYLIHPLLQIPHPHYTLQPLSLQPLLLSAHVPQRKKNQEKRTVTLIVNLLMHLGQAQYMGTGSTVRAVTRDSRREATHVQVLTTRMAENDESHSMEVKKTEIEQNGIVKPGFTVAWRNADCIPQVRVSSGIMSCGVPMRPAKVFKASIT